MCLVCGRQIEREEDVAQLLCSTDCRMVWSAAQAFHVVNRAMRKGDAA